MTTVVELTVASPAVRWKALGLTVVNGVARVGGIALRFTDASAGDPYGDPVTGVTGWTLADAPDPTLSSIDGLPTSHGEPPTDAAPSHR
ncbi:MAG TPA: hypothetical protein DCR14_17815, partial [Acidimicrobiaceae bacterium]|nr:hypothetical protein [Acidimicrobiaceae bacterium]